MSAFIHIKYLQKIVLFLSVAVALTFIGCSSGGDSSNTAGPSTIYTLEGKVQKGEFLNGTIVATKLNDDGSLSSDTQQSTLNEHGEYKLNISWSGPTHLIASGYYYDEYNAKKSSESIELEALYDVNASQKININLLSSLESNRIRSLLEEGKKLSEAKLQTKEELASTFSLSKSTESTALDMFDHNSTLKEENLNLLLLSASFLKITQEEDTLSASPAKLAPKKGVSRGKITSISRLLSDFSKNGKVDEVFKEEWEAIIEDNPVETISKVSKILILNLSM